MNILIDSKTSDVTGNGILDKIYLFGDKPYPPPSELFNNIKIVVIEGKNKIMEIPLKDVMGYNPRLFIGPFINKSIDDILVSIDSGGSGGFGYYYIYSLENNNIKSMFDTDMFNNSMKYDVNYLDNYQVEVINKTMKIKYLIDIKDKGNDYLKDLYNNNGKLIKSIKGDVLGLNNLYPIDINGDSIYELIATNRVIGLYGADTLGYIITPLIWNKNSFTIFNSQYLSVNGYDI